MNSKRFSLVFRCAPPSLKDNFHGFTLVEVIIVIAVISVVAAIGYPTLSKWYPNYNLKAATRIMHGDFQKAKLYAVKTNQNVTFSIADDNTCTGTTGYTFTATDGVVVASQIMGDGVCITNSNFTNGSSGFNSRGLPAGVTGAVRLSHRKLQPREQVINQTVYGSVRIQ